MSGDYNFDEEDPADEAIAAGVCQLVACVSDAPRVLPDDEIVRRIYRAVRTMARQKRKISAK